MKIIYTNISFVIGNYYNINIKLISCFLFFIFKSFCSVIIVLRRRCNKFICIPVLFLNCHYYVSFAIIIMNANSELYNIYTVEVNVNNTRYQISTFLFI